MAKPGVPAAVTAVTEYLGTLTDRDVARAVAGAAETRPGLRRQLISALAEQQGVAEGLCALVAVSKGRRPAPPPSGGGSSAGAGEYTEGELGVFSDCVARRQRLQDRVHRPQQQRTASPTTAVACVEPPRSLTAPALPHTGPIPRWSVTPRPPPPHRPQDGPILDSHPLQPTRPDSDPCVRRLACPVRPRNKALDCVTWREPAKGQAERVTPSSRETAGREITFEPGVGCLYCRVSKGKKGANNPVNPVLRLWFRAPKSQQDADAQGSGLNDGRPNGPVLLITARFPPDFADADADAPRLALPRAEEEWQLLVGRLRTLADAAGVRHNLPPPAIRAPPADALTPRQRAQLKAMGGPPAASSPHPMSADEEEGLLKRLYADSNERRQKVIKDLQIRLNSGTPAAAPPLDADGVEQANARLFYDEVAKRKAQRQKVDARIALPLAKPVEREEEDIEAATERLYSEGLQAAQMRRDDLNRKYLVSPPAKRLERDEMTAACSRLYTETVQKKEQKRLELWERHVGQSMPKTKKLNQAELKQIVERLNVAKA